MMYLSEFLSTLNSDPADVNSPALLVARDDLTKQEEDHVLGAVYARRPYVIIAGLPRHASIRLDNQRGYSTGALDLNLLKPRTLDGKRPSTNDMAALMAQIIAGIRTQVDELDEAYPLVGRMSIITEIDPTLVDLSPSAQYQATLRLAYRIGR